MKKTMVESKKAFGGYTLDHLLLISIGVCSAGIWSLFLAMLLRYETYNEFIALILLMGVGVWVGFSIGIGMAIESVDVPDDEVDDV